MVPAPVTGFLIDTGIPLTVMKRGSNRAEIAGISPAEDVCRSRPESSFTRCLSAGKSTGLMANFAN